jgi:hypothetical protein
MQNSTLMFDDFNGKFHSLRVPRDIVINCADKGMVIW